MTISAITAIAQPSFQQLSYDCNNGQLRFQFTGGNGSSLNATCPGAFGGTYNSNTAYTVTIDQNLRNGTNFSGTITQSGQQRSFNFTTSCTSTPPPTTPPPTTPPPTTTPTSLNPYSGDAYFINGVVGIGTTNVGDRGSLLSVRGRIRAQEVRIENDNWPEYVFSPAYKLPSLPALERYLNTHHHLPGVPSAQDVAQNGVLLGDMNARLLEKVEELTLHLIALEKRTRRQERELTRFCKQRLSTPTR